MAFGYLLLQERDDRSLVLAAMEGGVSVALVVGDWQFSPGSQEEEEDEVRTTVLEADPVAHT
jgi:hypothetical protein